MIVPRPMKNPEEYGENRRVSKHKQTQQMRKSGCTSYDVHYDIILTCRTSVTSILLGILI